MVSGLNVWNGRIGEGEGRGEEEEGMKVSEAEDTLQHPCGTMRAYAESRVVCIGVCYSVDEIVW